MQVTTFTLSFSKHIAKKFTFLLCCILFAKISAFAQPTGGGLFTTSGTDTTVCQVGLPVSIPLIQDGMGQGVNEALLVTTAQTDILEILPVSSEVTLNAGGPDSVQLYYIAYDTGLQGLQVGSRFTDLAGVWAVSNPVNVYQANPNGGMVSLPSGTTDTIITAGTTVLLDLGNTSTASGLVYTYVVTDDQDKILAFQRDSPGTPFDLLSGAPLGVCRVYGWNHPAQFDPVIGDQVSTLQSFDCGDVSTNYITVTRLGAITDRYVAKLNGQQQNPSVLSNGRGTIDATLRGDMLFISGSFSELDSDFNPSIGGGAHIHIGLAGQNGAVAFPLTTDVDGSRKGGSFSEADNAFQLTPTQLTLLEDRGLYINIHSLDHPMGEIRGQLLKPAVEHFQATLLGSNEIPAIHSSGFGNILFELENNNLTATGSFSGLSDSIAADLAGGAHLHVGFAGQAGPISIVLTLTPNADMKGATIEASNNTFILDQAAFNQLFNDSLYVNVHSLAFPTGELRGQVSKIGIANFRAQLTGMQELPAVNVESTGRIHLVYNNDNTISVSGSFKDLSADLATNIGGGIHIHIGTAGLTGPVEYVITPTLDGTGRSASILPSLNTFDLDGREDEIYDRELYVNVHSLNHPSGELRGQLLPLAKSYLGADLSGFNEVESAYSFGTGNFQFEITDNQLVLSGGFTNMISTFDPSAAGGCHLHYGTAIENGPIGLILNPRLDTDMKGGSFPTDENTFSISDGFRDSLLNGQIYVNVHSVRYPGGELRSQVLREDNQFPVGAVVIASPAIGDTVRLEDGPMPYNVASNNLSDPDGDILTYNYQLSFTETFSQTFYSQKVLDAEPAAYDAAAIYAAAIDTGLVWFTPRVVYQRMNVSDGAVSIFSARDSFVLILEPNVETVGGNISLIGGGTDTLICIDGAASPIAVRRDGNAVGTNFDYVITDDAGKILALPGNDGPFDLDGAGVGTCQIWYLASHDDLAGLAVDNNVNDLTGSFNFSNSITVVREASDAGAVSLSSGAVDTTVVTGDIRLAVLFTSTSVSLPYSYIVTDDQGVLLEVADARTTDTLDFSDAPVGVCRIYGYSSAGVTVPVAGQMLSSLMDESCEALTSQFITVVRTEPSDLNELSGLSSFNVFPNPAQDRLSIQIETEVALHGVLRLHNAAGLVVREVILSENSSTLDWNIKALPAGTYQAVLSNEKGVASRRIIIQ